MTIDIDTLFSFQTAADLLNSALDFAQGIGLPVSSWRVGDPTKTTFQHLATVLAARDKADATYAKSGFLSDVGEEWGSILAEEVYGVDRIEATASTPTVTVRNDGGGHYDYDPGDITFKSTASGVTFHNTSGTLTTLLPGTSATFDLVADVEGSKGTVVANEIDSLVTSAPGLTVLSSTAAIGLDEQALDSLKSDCRDTLGALSPNGPPDAYDSVARNSELTGVTNVTRSATTSDSDVGAVTVYIAGADGAVDGPTVSAVQAAILKWATPLTATPTTVSATEVPINVVVAVSGNLPPDAVAQLTNSVNLYFAGRPIARDTGETFYRTPFLNSFFDRLPVLKQGNVSMTEPSADVAYGEGQVPVPGGILIVVV